MTDARFSGVSTGACIGHVGPEALAGGPIGKVRDGDRIQIVIDRTNLKGTIDLVGEGDRVFDADEGARVLAKRPARPDLRPTRTCRTTRGCGRRSSASAAGLGRLRLRHGRDCQRPVTGVAHVAAARRTASTGPCCWPRCWPPSNPQPGEVVVDCTVGWAGHAAELLRRVGPTGGSSASTSTPRTCRAPRERLDAVGLPFALHHGNFAGLPAVLAAEGVDAAWTCSSPTSACRACRWTTPSAGSRSAATARSTCGWTARRGRTAAELLATIAGSRAGARRSATSATSRRPSAIAAAIVAARGRRAAGARPATCAS